MPRRSLWIPLFILWGALVGAGCREEGDIQITGLTFNGVEAVSESALRNVLQTRKGSWIPWGRKRFFDRGDFEADLKRIQVFYSDRGYLDARVTSFDVTLNDTQDKVDITVNVSEGEPIRIVSIDLQGFDVLRDRRQDRPERTLGLEVAQPLDRALVVTARERAVNMLRDGGYAYADVAVDEQALAPKQMALVFTAQPGPLSHFGEVSVSGIRSVDEEVVRRQLTFKPGDVYSRREIRASQQKLYGLELFEFVNIEPQADLSAKTPEIPAHITVGEGRHRRLTTGVGYGSEEQARARIRWDHLNFLGGARHAGFEGKWSSLDRGVRLDLREPNLFGSFLSAGFDGQVWQAEEPVYSLDSLGGRFTLKHQVSPDTSWSVSLSDEYQRSTITNAALEDLSIRDDLIALGLDPRTGESRGTLSAVSFGMTRSTTRNLLDARRGYVASVHLEQAGTWLWGTYNYWSLVAEGRHYLSLGRRAVFANRIRVGTIDGLGGEALVPFYKRFFIGGASSVRGWGRFELSPLSGSGLPIGGQSMLEGSTELRLPLWGKFGGVAFVDYGNVWPEPGAFRLGELRYAVGPGLRYVTPVGPARVDFGWQVNRIPNLLVEGQPETRRWRIHFSIGQAF